MTTITTRAGKGSPLTNAEVDTNFINLNTDKFEVSGGTITGPTVIDINSSTTALRITQTGSGSALRVEDSATPDSTPFVVDALGRVGINTATPAVGLSINRTDAVRLPVGTTAQRPTGAAGYLRFNSTIMGFEGFNGSTWSAVGPAGPQGPQGPQGVPGEKGDKGDTGNYLGIALIGSGTSLAQRPTSASEGQAWGLIQGDILRIYVWTSGAWLDAGPITAPSVFPVARTIYVQGNGSDVNSGSSLATAVATIERALQLATASGVPTLIEVYPGTYTTQGHLDMPDDCVIRSAHRTAVIRPAAGFETRNVFRMGSGCFVEGFLIEGFRVDSLTNPTSGFAFSFRPGAVINRVPYAHKCAIRTVRTWGPVAPPLDRDAGNPAVGFGGGVVLADGLVCSQYSPFPNIMTWGATPVTHNGIGYCAKNGGLINAVNAVSMWAHKHFLALSGGQIILSACSTQFGDYSMVSDGYRDIVVPVAILNAPTFQPAAASTVAAAQSGIIDTMWAALVAGGYTVGWTAADEAATRYDAALFLQCIRWGLEYANYKPIQDFAVGLFNAVGVPVFDVAMTNAFIYAFQNMRDQINALGIGAAAQTMVIDMTAAVISTVSSPSTRREPSKITAIGHTWTAVMAGVALARIPPANNAASIQDSIREQDEGVVVASGQDDQGNAIFVGGLVINADTGELGGPPFEAAVRRVATRTAIARSF